MGRNTYGFCGPVELDDSCCTVTPCSVGSGATRQRSGGFRTGRAAHRRLHERECERCQRLEAVARNSRGHVVGSVGVPLQSTHGDPAGSTLALFDTSVPARSAASIVLTSGGHVLSRITKPRAVLHLSLTRKLAGKLRGKSVTVRFRLGGVAGAIVREELDVSSDSGRHWHPVEIGGRHGTITVAISALGKRTHSGRLRLVVSDGFRTTEVRSGVLSWT